MTRFRLTISVVALGLALTLSACGDSTGAVISGTAAATGGEADNANNATRPDAAPGSGTGDGTGSDATTTAAEATSTASDALLLSISNKPDQPQYNQGVMQAPVGSKIVVNYDNPSQEPHNWVLVEPGQEQAVVDAAAAKNGNPEGIPGVIAWSQPISSGSATIEVPALDGPGGYTYLCTVPGHFAAGHKGAFDVK
jgi:azurin